MVAVAAGTGEHAHVVEVGDHTEDRVHTNEQRGDDGESDLAPSRQNRNRTHQAVEQWSVRGPWPRALHATESSQEDKILSVSSTGPPFLPGGAYRSFRRRHDG